MGIGTKNPTEKLHVVGDIKASTSIHSGNSSGFSDFWSSNGSWYTMPYGYLGTNGSYRLTLMWNGYRNSDNTWTSIGVNGYNSGAGVEIGNDGIDFRYSGVVTAGAAPQSRMKITSNGNVGIGTTSPSYKLHVNGTAYATGAAGSLSDRRHKENISDLSIDALKVVKELRPVTFEWKEPQDNGMEGSQLGFIAQEVEEALPEAVLTQENEEQTK